MKRDLLLVYLIWISITAFGQHKNFTKADSLRGFLSPERTCFDVSYYHLDILVDPAEKYIEGSNTIQFDVTAPTSRIQLDLFKELNIKSVER